MKSYTKEQERVIDEVILRLSAYGLCPDDLYSSASNGSKPHVSGSLPLSELPNKCDICGCSPSAIIRTQYGTFCVAHVRY